MPQYPDAPYGRYPTYPEQPAIPTSGAILGSALTKGGELVQEYGQEREKVKALYNDMVQKRLDALEQQRRWEEAQRIRDESLKISQERESRAQKKQDDADTKAAEEKANKEKFDLGALEITQNWQDELASYDANPPKGGDREAIGRKHKADILKLAKETNQGTSAQFFTSFMGAAQPTFREKAAITAGFRAPPGAGRIEQPIQNEQQYQEALRTLQSLDQQLGKYANVVDMRYENEEEQAKYGQLTKNIALYNKKISEYQLKRGRGESEPIPGVEQSTPAQDAELDRLSTELDEMMEQARQRLNQ